MERLASGDLGTLLEKLGPAMAAGSVSVLSVEKIRESVGVRWDRKLEAVQTFIERAFVRTAVSGSLITSLNDVEYIAVQPGADRWAALNVNVRVLQETLQFFLGASDLEDVKIYQVKSFSGGRLDIQAVSSSDLTPANDTAARGAVAGAGKDGQQAAVPILRPIHHTVASVTTLPITNGGNLSAELWLEPIWNIAQQVVSSYVLCSRLTQVEADDFILLDDLSTSDCCLIARACVQQAVHWIEASLRRKRPVALHVPISLRAIGTAGGRYPLLQYLRELSEDVRKLLVLEIVGLEDGLPHSRMAEIVSALSPSCRAVLARSPSHRARLSEWRGCALSGVTLDCAMLEADSRQSAAVLERAIEGVRGVAKMAVAYNLRSRSLVLSAWAAGFTHVSGEPVAPAKGQPRALRWSPNDFYSLALEQGPLKAASDEADLQASGAKAPQHAEPSSASADLDIAAWLSAMDGVAYLVDADGHLLAAAGEPRRPDGWANDHEGLVIGRNILDHISGADVGAYYRRVHEALLRGGAPTITFEFRCDAPDIKRKMRMSISRLDLPGQPSRILYQSQILSAVSRPWMSLFEADRILERLREDAHLPIVTMCSICQRVAMPTAGDWVEAEEYYQRGGSGDVRISHGVCTGCHDVLDEEIGSGHAPAAERLDQ